MATCHDCTHLYCCKYDRFFGVDDVENKCNYFKNKADFVEVIRCKDCERRNTELCHMGFYNTNGEFMCLVKGTDFCSYGERK